MAQIHCVVEDEKKEKWDTAVDETVEYSSLSDLIRLSVERELAGEHDTEQQSVEFGGKIDEVLEGVSRLGEQIDNLESRISSIEKETTKDPKIGELTSEIYPLLPTKKPGTKSWHEKNESLIGQKKAAEAGQESGPPESIQDDIDAWSGTIEGLSSALDESERRVRKAVERLKADVNLVRETDDGRFYKVE